MQASRRSFLKWLGIGAVAAPVVTSAVTTEAVTAAPADSTVLPGDLYIFDDANYRPRIGYVRCNGSTIGHAASPASERASQDCQNLFTHLWENLDDTQARVHGGRGGRALTDWLQNKTIQLPDYRPYNVYLKL